MTDQTERLRESLRRVTPGEWRNYGMRLSEFTRALSITAGNGTQYP